MFGVPVKIKLSLKHIDLYLVIVLATMIVTNCLAAVNESSFDSLVWHLSLDITLPAVVCNDCNGQLYACFAFFLDLLGQRAKHLEVPYPFLGNKSLLCIGSHDSSARWLAILKLESLNLMRGRKGLS